jgi:hypothetical protein
MVPVKRPIDPPLGVPQQPTVVPALGTATCLVALDQSDLGQEDSDQEPPKMVPDPDVDFAPCDWLFTAAKADRVGGIEAGLRQY